MMDTLIQKFVLNGGPMMFVLIPCSLLMVGAVLQGLIRLRKGRVLDPQIAKQAQRIDGVLARRKFVMDLRRLEVPLARAVWLTLKDFDLTAQKPQRQQLESSVSEAAAFAADEMRDRLNTLSTLYTIAPLLGLMGTILGMMNTFYNFAVAEEKSVKLLSIGIQEALVTTLWGLAIAIPAFVAAQVLESIITRYERNQLVEATGEVIQHLYNNDTDPIFGEAAARVEGAVPHGQVSPPPAKPMKRAMGREAPG